MATKAVAEAPEATSDESARTKIADRTTEAHAVVRTTRPDGTTAGNAPIVAGESQPDAEHISPASPDEKINPNSVLATPDPSAASEPDAEALSASVTPVTHPDDPSPPVLTSQQANALFPIENYGAYTAGELHDANLANFEEGERLHGKFTAHLYDRVLPGLNESIKRLKNGEEINGFSGERQVGAYLESIGYKADLVRQWNKRYLDRMAKLKKTLGLTDHNAPANLTPAQRELRDTLIQQGYKKPEATRLAKAAEGNSVVERFEWVMKQRASEISGTGTAGEEPNSGPATAATETSTAAEPGTVTNVTDATADELDGDRESDRPETPEPNIEVTQEEETPVVQPTPAVTFQDWETFWEKHPLPPSSEYERRHFAEAAASFIDRYRYAFASSAFKKSLAILKDNPDQVRANADDFTRIATVLRAAAENATLLAAVITTALTHPMEPEPRQTKEGSQKTSMKAKACVDVHKPSEGL